jgi:hypothetical protein
MASDPLASGSDGARYSGVPGTPHACLAVPNTVLSSRRRWGSGAHNGEAERSRVGGSDRHHRLNASDAALDLQPNSGDMRFLSRPRLTPDWGPWTWQSRTACVVRSSVDLWVRGALAATLVSTGRQERT